MSCECGGTGWLIYTGNYRSNVTGNTMRDGEQAKRCPSYIRYFGESTLMRDYPEKCPVPLGGVDCAAALSAHKAIIDAALKREAEKESARSRRR